MRGNTEKFLVASWLCFCCLTGAAQDVTWSWNGKKVPAGVRYSRQCSVKTDSAVRTPAGEPTLAVTLTTRPAEARIHSIQLNFCTRQKIVAGRRYRISFPVQSSVAGEIAAQIIEGVSPWKDIGRSWRKISVDTEWRTVSVDCVAERNFEGELRAPMIMLGEFPVGGTLRFGPVRFESVIETVPLTLNPEWQLFVRPELAPGELAALKRVPDRLGGVKGKKIVPQKGMLEISASRSVKAVAVLMNEFDSPVAGQVRIGCGADYWFEFLVNGKSVYNTLASGNGAEECSNRDHVFFFPVKKGRNLIVVRVLSGSNGWKFTCGEIPAGQKADRITEIVAGREWRPLKMDRVEWEYLKPKRLDQFKVVPGSALDLSRQFTRFEIDRLGRLTANAEGKLVFENAPDQAVRLRGFNFMPGGWVYRFYKMSHAELEELAEQIRLQGINVLRYHFLDSVLCGRSGFPTPRAKLRKLPDVPKPSSPDALPIDAAFLDRFDYFNKCCRERGIYLMVDILTDGNSGWTSASDKVPMRENFRFGMLFDHPGYRANYLAGFRFLMNHVNPYTGKRMVDDPQFIGITFLNEYEHLFSDKSLEALTPEWRRFRNPTAPESVPAFSRQLLAADTPDGVAARAWLQDRIDEINRFFLAAAENAGFRGFVTLWDMFMRNLEGVARRGMNAVSMHTYFAHPISARLAPATYRQRLQYGRWLRGTMMKVVQSSSIVHRNGYFNRAAATRVFGKPFLLTEYSHNGYNRYSHEAGLLQGATAALQGWDALMSHCNLIALYYEPFRAFSFDNGSNPAAKVASLLTAFLWQRGDMAEAGHAVNFVVSPERAGSTDLLGAIGSGCNALAFLTRIGSNYEGKKLSGAWNVEPPSFTGARSRGMYVVLTEETREQEELLRRMVGQLRTGGILPADNRTDPACGLFESETGELLVDTRRHTLSIVTPRTEGAVCKGSRLVKLDTLTISANSIPCAIAAVSLDRRETLREAERILLVIATQFAAANSVWSTENFDAELDVGRLQLLCRTGKFELSLETNRGKVPKLYALNFNGTREKELPVRFENGTLYLLLDTSKLEYGTPYFEIVY